MPFLKHLRSVRPKMLFQLVYLSVSHPLFILPTFWATQQCMTISTKEYGREHYLNGPANAFRHALWNVLIAKKCSKWYKNLRYVLNWTTKITYWHEEAFPNWNLARKMDLHNNRIGREIYVENREMDLSAFIDRLKNLTEKAVLVTTEKDFINHTKQLVYIHRDEG